METKICVFNENAISFLVDKENSLMVNATEMAKSFDKRLDHFLKSDHAKEFIRVLEFTPFGGNSAPLKKEEIMISRGSAGTYFHRILALKFAAWLSPEFEVWVFATIEKLLFGKHVEREQSFERTLKLKSESDKLRDKAPEERTGEDFNRFLEIERELRRERAVRKSLTTESITGMRSLFENDEDDE